MELPSFLNVTPPQPSPAPQPEPTTPLPLFGWRTPSWHPSFQNQPVVQPTPPPRKSVGRPPALPMPENEDVRARMLAQFEAVFPRLMECIYAGDTLKKAIEELPPTMGGPIDYGQFNKWVMRNPRRKAIYEEAKEARTEVWADRMIEHAEKGVDANGDTVTLERSKFAFDTYKHLMGKQNKKVYGETKTVEVEHRISIRSALEQAQQRVLGVTTETHIDVEAEVVEEENEDE